VVGGCAADAVGDKFKGLKMIPAGLHLLIVGTGHGSKVGEFVRVEPGRVIVRRFDPALEDLAVGEGYRNDQVRPPACTSSRRASQATALSTGE
jgi:hypothetical protein